MNENPFTLSSSAFENKNEIPSIYTCDGKNISPPLHIEGLPGGVKSLALIMDDPDAPSGMWVHWVRWNIPVETIDVGEGAEPMGIPGNGSGGNTYYKGPCPPSGIHRYYFKLYALDTELDIPEGSPKEDLLEAMVGHILAESELMGTYTRNKLL